MAPGVPVPQGTSGVPGHLEFRALKAFAAGNTGFVGDLTIRQQRKAECISDSVDNLAGRGKGGGGPLAMGAERGGVEVGGGIGNVGEAFERRAAEADVASELARDSVRVREVEAAEEAAATEEREQVYLTFFIHVKHCDFLFFATASNDQ